MEDITKPLMLGVARAIRVNAKVNTDWNKPRLQKDGTLRIHRRDKKPGWDRDYLEFTIDGDELVCIGVLEKKVPQLGGRIGGIGTELARVGLWDVKFLVRLGKALRKHDVVLKVD